MSWLNAILVILTAPYPTLSLYCSRYPANTFTAKSPVDDNFAISVNGNPQTYILGQEYNISINAFNGLRFVSFMLTLENDNGDVSYKEDLGRFELSDSVETRYSPNCINMVENTNTNSKTRVDVTWKAPEQPGGGCVLLRATVLQHRDVWYMDDGALTKRICEEIVDDVESQSVVLSSQQPCCACDEARYDIIFDGLWSRNLHPKDFPTKGWLTRFSDIVGASHKANYRFWEYGTLASLGMREFAEHGSTRILEQDFNANFKNGEIRTIIRARGPAFPNLSGRSIASVRVDAAHHLISLASKIEPSPDWVVGVSGLELCMANCTWSESKVVYLYPWDVGTDAGPSYTSPTQPQLPADVIRRMRSDFPNDPRSPFYDETGAPMKPLATLTIKRQRLYERLCEDEESNNVDVARECATHPWSAWSQCTAKCGEGRQYRSRVFKQPEVAKIYNCDVLLVNRQNRTCVGSACGEAELPYNPRSFGFRETAADPIDDPYGSNSGVRAECGLTDWGAWSECNSTCGAGKMWRRRQFINPMAEAQCQNAAFVNLHDYRPCTGQSCLGEVRNTHGVGERHWQEEDWPHSNGENWSLGSEVSGQNSGSFDYSGTNGQNERPFDYSGTNGQNAGPFDYSGTNGQNTGPFDYSGTNGQNAGPFDYSGTNGQNAGPYSYDGYPEENISSMPNENLNYGSDFEVGDLIQTAGEHREQANFFQKQHRPQKQLQKQNNFDIPRREQPEQPASYNPSLRTQENADGFEVPAPVPAYCFESLHIFNCLDANVTGNFWFYNYCQDECMLYASDSCDRNQNKFTSLEMCELRCRQPATEAFLKSKQLRDCPSSQRTREQMRRHKARVRMQP